jgi:hypothetical protein
MRNLTSGKAVFFALSVAALVRATPAQAQSSYSMRMNVPFQFVAGNQVLPAGPYSFTVDSAFHVLRIQPRKGTATSIVPIMAVSERRSRANLDKGMLRFADADGVHVLSGVWQPGSEEGAQTVPSKQAMAAARSAQSGTASLYLK